jgi:hypothetical protein
MATQPLPSPDDWRDEWVDDMRSKVDEHGYGVVVVGTGECSFPGCTCEPEQYPYAYSIGMVEHGLPELVTFGVPLSHVNALMRPVFEAGHHGELEMGREARHRFGTGAPVALVPVPRLWVQRDPGRIGGWIDLYSGSRPIPDFVQVCWADRDDRMPWDTGSDPAAAALQPVLADDPLRYPRPPRNNGRHRRR